MTTLTDSPVASLDVPDDLAPWYEQAGRSNSSGTAYDLGIGVASEMIAEYEYFSQQQPRHPVGSPLSTNALITYDDDGGRWAVPIRGGGQPVPIGWGILNRAFDGDMFSAGGILPGGRGTVYGRESLAIKDLAAQLLNHERSLIADVAEHQARLARARDLKYAYDRETERHNAGRADQARRLTCPVCHKVDRTTDIRFVHNGVNARGTNSDEPTLFACLPCWGRAHTKWLTQVSKGR